MTVLKFKFTGSATIASAIAVPAGQVYKLESMTLHLDGNPTTSENLTVTMDANEGAAYDTILFSQDLSVGTVVDLLWFPDGLLYFEGGDEIAFAFANTETNTYGLQVVVLTGE